MKKLFLILLILPIGLLADDWIFNVENTTMVTAYFNIFNAIAALFKNDSYIDLLRLAFLVGGFFVFAKGVLAAWEGSASAHMLSPYGKYLAVGVALLTLIFSQTSTLWIEAKELPTYCPGAAAGTPATTGFAVELPSVLAYVFKATNTIGTELTYLAEAAFTNPSNPAGSAAMSDSDGYLGSLKATIGLLNINPSYVTLSKRDEAMADKATDFVQDFRMFYQSCITQNNQNQGSEGRDQDYKIMNSKDIMKTIDAYIGTASQDTGFQFSSGKYPGNAYTNIYGVPKTCRAVWTDLKSTEGAIAKFAAKMCSVYPNMNGGVFELITGTYGTGAALEMTGIGIQAGLINAIKASNKYDSIGIQGGGSFTSGESRASTNLEQLSTASYMAEMIPYLQMTMRAVLYAFFPFVFVVVLLPGGLTVLAQYLQTMIWIELWTPTAAIVNMFINLRVKDTVGEEYSKEGLTLMTSVDMLSEANTIAGVGAVLYLSIPPLTWLILKGSGQMLGGMLSSHSSGFSKNLESNKRGEDAKVAETGRVMNNERASKNMAALSYGERTHYESLREGNQVAGSIMASMDKGLNSELTTSQQKITSDLGYYLGREERYGKKAASEYDISAKLHSFNKDNKIMEANNITDKKGNYNQEASDDRVAVAATSDVFAIDSDRKYYEALDILNNNAINKKALGKATDVTSTSDRNKFIQEDVEQKVMKTGIGENGEKEMIKNATTQSNKKEIDVNSENKLQGKISNEERENINSSKDHVDLRVNQNLQNKFQEKGLIDAKTYNESIIAQTSLNNQKVVSSDLQANLNSMKDVENVKKELSKNSTYQNQMVNDMENQIFNEFNGLEAEFKTREEKDAAVMLAIDNLAEKGLYSQQLTMRAMSNPKSREILQKIGAIKMDENGAHFRDTGRELNELLKEKGSDSIEYLHTLANLRGNLDGTAINHQDVNGTKIGYQTSVLNPTDVAKSRDFGNSLTGVDAMAHVLNEMDVPEEQVEQFGLVDNGLDKAKKYVKMFVPGGKKK